MATMQGCLMSTSIVTLSLFQSGDYAQGHRLPARFQPQKYNGYYTELAIAVDLAAFPAIDLKPATRDAPNMNRHRKMTTNSPRSSPLPLRGLMDPPTSRQKSPPAGQWR